MCRVRKCENARCPFCLTLWKKGFNTKFCLFENFFPFAPVFTKTSVFVNRCTTGCYGKYVRHVFLRMFRWMPTDDSLPLNG